MINPTNHSIKSSNVNGPNSMTLKNGYNPDFSRFTNHRFGWFHSHGGIIEGPMIGYCPIVLLIGMMYDSGSFIVDIWKRVLIVAPILRMNEKKHKT